MIHYIVGRNFGHLSRCVANVEQFRKISKESVKIYAFKHSHSWLRSNLPKVKIRKFSKKKVEKKGKNLLKADLVIHDWRKEVRHLKELRGKKGPILSGIYHSDMFLTEEDNKRTKKFKEEVQQIADKTTDIFFHMNLIQPEQIPKLSTCYVPIPIIARELTKNPRQVKKRIGIPKDEPFILIHMGGGVGPYKYKWADQWFKKFIKLKTSYRVVVANQFGGVKYKFPKRMIQAPLFENGLDLINAADLVISKPGMGIMIDCITTGTPLLALPADSKEREVKNMMLKDLVGSDICLTSNRLTPSDLSKQIREIMDYSGHFRHVFGQIPKNGADIMAESMDLLSRNRLKDLPDVHEKILSLTPFQGN
jgi:UDP:flavonoid glycosyltransferase YjiC (YdhE family)